MAKVLKMLLNFGFENLIEPMAFEPMAFEPMAFEPMAFEPTASGRRLRQGAK